MADIDIRDASVQEAIALAAGDRIPIFKTAAGKRYIDPAFFVGRANHTGTQLAATISDFDAQVSANPDVLQNTTDNHTHINKGILDDITDAGSGVIISTAERDKIGFIAITQAVDLDAIETKIDSIVITDNASIITIAQIDLLTAFQQSQTVQSISGTGVQAFDLNSGCHANVIVSGAIDLALSNGVAGKNGLITLTNTNGQTLDLSGSGLTFKKRGASGILEAYSQITLSVGATDEQVIAYHFRTSTEVIYAID